MENPFYHSDSDVSVAMPIVLRHVQKGFIVGNEGNDINECIRSLEKAGCEVDYDFMPTVLKELEDHKWILYSPHRAEYPRLVITKEGRKAVRDYKRFCKVLRRGRPRRWWHLRKPATRTV